MLLGFQDGGGVSGLVGAEGLGCTCNDTGCTASSNFGECDGGETYGLSTFTCEPGTANSPIVPAPVGELGV